MSRRRVGQIIGSILSDRCDGCGATVDEPGWMIAVLRLDPQGRIRTVDAVSVTCLARSSGHTEEQIGAMAAFHDRARAPVSSEAHQEADGLDA